MGSIERLNYILNDVESIIGRNALNHKLFNNTLLISIVPDTSFSNLQSISFVYQKTPTDKIQKEYLVSNDLFSIHGDDLASKILLFSDTLTESDRVQINNYYKDIETLPEQNLINFFTLGLASFITLCQLIQNNPVLFSPYNLTLPESVFNISSLTRQYINYVDSYLFNIIQGKTSNLVKKLASNASSFNKYFSNMFNPGTTTYDISKPIQASMRDFKDHTYNPTEIISSHINIIERNKDDALNELRSEADFRMQEIRDLYLTKADGCCDNIFSRQQDCLSEIDAAQDRIDQSIQEFECKSKETLAKLTLLAEQVEKRYNDVEDIYNQAQSLASCGGNSCENSINEKLVSDMVNKYISMNLPKPDTTISTKLDSISSRLDGELARYKNGLSRLEKMVGKILDSIDNC
jgi:hypothetical protein